MSGVGFLFPGIGDHHALLGQALMRNIPYVHAGVQQRMALLAAQYQIDLRWTLSASAPATPVSSTRFSALVRNATSMHDTQKALLSKTVYAHSFVFIHQCTLAEYLLTLGLTPRWVMGYSLGEITAAVIAGAFTFEQALDFIVQRARIIASLPETPMLAVAAAADTIAALLGEALHIAAMNSPNHTMVAGPEHAIATLEATCSKARIATRRIQANHPFHTPLLSSAIVPLSKVLTPIERGELRCDWLSSIDLHARRAGERIDHAYWLTQLVQPVRWQDMAVPLSEHDDFLLEIGPGQSLSTSLRQNPRFPRDGWHRLLPLSPNQFDTRDEYQCLQAQLEQCGLSANSNNCLGLLLV